MVRTLQNTYGVLGITVKDAQFIYDSVQAFPELSIKHQKEIIQKYFEKDIKPEHYMYLGFLIGYFEGTDKAFEEIYKSTEVCQRVN